MALHTKYFDEFDLNLDIIPLMFVQPEAIKKITENVPSYKHLYLITKCKRIEFCNPNINNGKLYLDVKITNQNSYVFQQTVGIPLKLLPEQLEEKFNNATNLISQYPFKYVELLNENEKVFYEFSPMLAFSMVAHHENIDVGDYLNLEVMYVGQAFGKDGEKEAEERLINHEKLQNVLASKRPDEDVWVILAKYEASLIHSMNPSADDEREEHWKRVIFNPISEKQKVTIAEAALIRYFSPLLNIEYKGTFPRKSLDSINEVYKLDFNSVSFTLDTTREKLVLFSKQIKPSMIHKRIYHLHKPEKRINMYKCMVPDEYIFYS